MPASVVIAANAEIPGTDEEYWYYELWDGPLYPGSPVWNMNEIYTPDGNPKTIFFQAAAAKTVVTPNSAHLEGAGHLALGNVLHSVYVKFDVNVQEGVWIARTVAGTLLDFTLPLSGTVVLTPAAVPA